MLELDPWQKEFIEYKGNKILVAGRQTGKSEAQGADNGQFALENPLSTTLILSKTERQSEELLIKSLNHIMDVAPARLGKGEWKPLKHCFYIRQDTKNDYSRVMSLPTGLAGEGIKGFTVHKMSIDEAQLVPDDVFYNVSPMMLTTGGFISLTGTPRGRKGFFYEAYKNTTGQWKVFHVNSEEVIKNRPISPAWPEWRREAALKFLEAEKKRMPAKWYAQEYLAQFVEDLMQFFPQDVIDTALVLERPDHISQYVKYYLGVDVGRFIDPSTFEIIAVVGDQHIHVESIVRKDISIPDTAQLIQDLHARYKFKKIGIDGGGLGVGVVDILNKLPIGDRVIDLNNSKRLVSRNEERTGRLLKEGMYLNMLSNMQTGKLKLLADRDVRDSIESIQIDYGEKRGEPIIFSLNNHITEGLVRADYVATQDKGLKLFATSSNFR